ncbi:MAG: glycosyltransferase family 4 protein [Chloroflexi bacterium]|nr:glycosyltransferase family 4 protein [Chloroflexota bacterium]MCI0579658.1 glycosyltransferase family 4 protein [Chloroflexota bacterium]MCI0645902.1 glycosyltransferase family 4 protein [Chloroflexota bacterium]MCI0725757.1 glycosyltransferase family 4 protein [Chloroflexota bacterium]
MERKQVRLLFLAGYLGFGGSERQLSLLLENLDRRLFETHVVVFNPSPTLTYETQLRASGVTLWLVPPECRGIWRRARFLYKLLRSLAPDIVHSWTTYANPYAGLVGRLAGIPVRWGSLRNSLVAEGVGDLPALYRLLCLRSVSRLIVNAAAVRQELLARGYAPDRIILLPNCVPAPAGNGQAPDLSSLGIGPSSRVVGLVGNIRPQKNPLLFVEAMATVLPNFADVQAMIVGQPLPQDPTLPDRLDRAIRRSRLDGWLVLAGFRGDVPALMRRFAVFCLTSDYEGMPNVVLEAMAAGCPVVATRVGGLPELIEDGVNGLLVEPGDTAGLARAVSRLLADPALARMLGTNGQKTIEHHFSCEQAARQLAGYYQEALAERFGKSFYK